MEPQQWTPAAPLFQSFLQGGFEASSHRRRDGRRIDVIGGTRHDQYAAEDYRLIRGVGLSTARDALRWHLIERTPGCYDWSSFLPMLRAARDSGIEVIWDLCHYGVPPDLDIWAPAFVDRFAAFAGAAARLVREEGGQNAIWCPMNEVSFWSWAGGDRQELHPYAQGQGPALKVQLMRASIAATEAVRAVDRRARFLQAEPLIHICPNPAQPFDDEAVEKYRMAQYESWDMLAGMLRPELGGRPELLDVVGVNFYCNNQWVHNSETLGLGHRWFRPLSDMLAEVYDRYRRPLVISETGAEAPNGPGWLRYVGGEVRTALRRGVPIEGLCIYPIMDYPGWNDDRHCPAGLIRLDQDYRGRSVDPEMVLAIEEQAMLLRPLLSRPHALGVAAE